MQRLVTFRFDDGYIAGARKAARILRPDPASFFIITGRVREEGAHGSIGDWREMAADGHDIQPHGVVHAGFAEMGDEQKLEEIRGSLAWIRQIQAGPYVFCFPFNRISDIGRHVPDLAAAGFHTVDSSLAAYTNALEPDLDWFRLRSWAVRERHLDHVVDQLEQLPDRTWTILALHSLDGEGHEPWSSDGFSRLVAAVRAASLKIVSVQQAVSHHRSAAQPA